jgi:hypothetical protein
VIVWARPNPPVGSLGKRNPITHTGDAKFRPATSYITVACRGTSRYFDLDAVRTAYDEPPPNGGQPRRASFHELGKGGADMGGVAIASNPAGAPPLDWHADDHPEDGDWLWKLSTQPYRGAHYATFPLELPTRLIMAMCPLRVCTVCGKPSERITERTPEYAAFRSQVGDFNERGNGNGVSGSRSAVDPEMAAGAQNVTVGWSDCGCSQKWSGHNTWRTGRVLDPFAGSGTTLQAAQNVGRHATGIDLDPRNAHLAQARVGMFLEVNP